MTTMSRPRHILSSLAVAFVVPFAAVAWSPAAAAQEPVASPLQQPGKIEVGKNGFVLPVGQIDPGELIDSAAIFLGRNILWQESELGKQPPFVFQRQLALDALGCEELLCEMLATRSLVVTPIDLARQVWEVVNLNGPRGREVMARAVQRSVDEVLKRPNLKLFVQVAVPLQHINANIATNALRPFFSGYGGGSNMPGLVVGTAGTNEAVLLMGFADQVAGCIRLLQQCDKPLEERNPDLASLQQAVASLQNSISELQARVATSQRQITELQKAAAKPADPAK